MSGLTVKQLRSWQRRVRTIERHGAEMLSEAISAAGLDLDIGGENFTSQFDELMATAEGLDSYLDTAINVVKQQRASRK